MYVHMYVRMCECTSGCVYVAVPVFVCLSIGLCVFVYTRLACVCLCARIGLGGIVGGCLIRITNIIY